jgi:hypothetical protein
VHLCIDQRRKGLLALTVLIIHEGPFRGNRLTGRRLA